MKQFYNYFLFTIFALTTTSMSYAQNTPVFTNATGSEGTLGGVPFTITESTGYPSSFFNADLTLSGKRWNLGTLQLIGSVKLPFVSLFIYRTI